jgi:hypothetical protein
MGHGLLCHAYIITMFRKAMVWIFAVSASTAVVVARQSSVADKTSRKG